MALSVVLVRRLPPEKLSRMLLCLGNCRGKCPRMGRDEYWHYIYLDQGRLALCILKAQELLSGRLRHTIRGTAHAQFAEGVHFTTWNCYIYIPKRGVVYTLYHRNIFIGNSHFNTMIWPKNEVSDFPYTPQILLKLHENKPIYKKNKLKSWYIHLVFHCFLLKELEQRIMD